MNKTIIMQFTTRVLNKLSYSFIRELLVIFIFVFVCSNVFAQPFDAGSFIPPSPEAEAFANMVNAEISAYTGAPSVNIPLYTLKGDNLSFPISLSYNTTGFKVDELASRVGLGWTLNSGGVISRVIRGMPDDRFYQVDIPDDTQGGSGGIADVGGYLHVDGPTEQGLPTDYIPDLYYYSFPGYSGSFTYDKNGTIVQTPYTNLKIEMIMSTVSDPDIRPKIIGFNITTPNGVKYTFDLVETTSQLSYPTLTTSVYIDDDVIPGADTPRSPWNSAFYLSKIEDQRTGELMTLGYETLPFLRHDRKKFEYDIATSGCFCDAQEPGADSITSSSRSVRVINRISSRYGYIQFLRNDRDDLPGDQKIYGFEVHSYSPGIVPIHKFLFTQSYWQSTGGASPDLNKRLRLDQVTEYGSEGGTKPPWVFTYDETMALPPRLSKEQDIWGYFNNNNASTLIPKLWVYPENGQGEAFSAYPRSNESGPEIILPGADRRSNESAMKVGMLTQIQYPIGGTVDYEYHMHEFNYHGEVYSGGGLRVAAVEVSSDYSTYYSYTYPDSETTSGYAVSMPQYAYVCDAPASGVNWNNFFTTYTKRASVNQTQLGVTQGSNVGYKHTTAHYPENGKTVYTYTSPEDYPDIAASQLGDNCLDNSWGVYDQYPFVQGTNMDHWRGLLLEQKDYSYGGSLVRKIENSYTSYDKGHIDIGYWQYAEHPSLGGFSEFGGSFDIKSEFVYKDRSTETVYDQGGTGGSVATEKAYEYYPDPVNLKSESVTNSDGAVHRTKYYYATTTNAPCLVANDVISIPVKAEKYIGGALVGGYVNEYYGDCFTKEFKEILSDGQELVRVSIGSYTSDGFPEDYTEMGFPTEDLTWSSGLLIARDRVDWHWDYTYEPNLRKVASITDIDGQVSTFEYDEFARLEKAKARGDNVITTYEYVLGGNPNKIVTTTTFTDDTPTQTLEQEFDGLGRLTGEIVNGVGKKYIVYNNKINRVDRETYLPGSSVKYEYEPSPLNRRIEAIFPDGNNVITQYGSEDNYFKVTTINERNHASSEVTDILGRISKTIDANGNSTTYQYDNRSNLEFVYPPSGAPYTYTYDVRNRMESKLIPGSKVQIFRYDDATDLMEYSIDANGNRMDYVYDIYGREKEVKHNELGSWNPDDPNYYNSVSNHGSAGSLVIENVYGESYGGIRTGKLVSTKAKILGSSPSSYAQSLFQYDAYGRVSLQQDFHHLGTDYYNFTHNLADWTLEESRTHTKGGNQIELITKHGYDNFGRELFYNTRIDGEDALIGIGMSYNEKDQMVGKYYGGLDPFSALDYAKYKYNVRGWVTNINDVTYGLQMEGACGELIDRGGDVIQVEQEVDKDGLLDWLCEEGPNVTIADMDPCIEDDEYCFYYDYIAAYSVRPRYTAHGYKAANQLMGLLVSSSPTSSLIPLTYPYYYDDPTSMEALEMDLKAWMDTESHPYDDVSVEVDVVYWDEEQSRPKRYDVKISIINTKGVIFSQVTETLLGTTAPIAAYHPFAQYFKYGIPCMETGKEGEKTQAASLLDVKSYIASTNVASITFPMIAYQTELEDNSSRWIPKDALPLLTGKYVKGKRLHISDPLEILEVRYQNDNQANLSLPAFYLQIANDLGINIKDIETDSDEEECEPPTFPCNPEQQQAQQESVASIQNAICNLDAEDLECPLTVSMVQLCDGSIIYIPGEELLNELEGPYVILNQLDFDADDIITILVSIPRPLFSMHFSDHQENGNIAEMRWKVTDRSVKQYNFTYDPLDRMTSANYGYYTVSPVPPSAPPGSQPIPNFVASEEYSVVTANYDAVGNLTEIIRNGMVPGVECLEPTEIDNLTLKPDAQTNRLQYVFDNAPIGGRSHGFKPGGGGNGSGLPPYSYDDNGNLTHDPHKGISISSYNFLNLPEQIGNMQITYDATGRKWEKIGEGNVKTEYISGIEYRDNNLEAIYAPDGRIVYDHVGDEYRTEYFRQDHLGNNRLTFCDFNNNGIIEISDDPNTPTNELEITQETHYYPFGMEQNGNWYATVTPDNQKLYNGKEFNRDWDINLYDYGARWYDPAIGRFANVDPLAEAMSNWSPYNYTFGNPLKYNDPTGALPCETCEPPGDRASSENWVNNSVPELKDGMTLEEEKEEPCPPHCDDDEPTRMSISEWFGRLINSLLYKKDEGLAEAPEGVTNSLPNSDRTIRELPEAIGVEVGYNFFVGGGAGKSFALVYIKDYGWAVVGSVDGGIGLDYSSVSVQAIAAWSDNPGIDTYLGRGVGISSDVSVVTASYFADFDELTNTVGANWKGVTFGASLGPQDITPAPVGGTIKTGKTYPILLFPIK